MSDSEVAIDVAGRFALQGRVCELAPIEVGLINATYELRCEGGRRYVLQRLNGKVFADPVAVMGNVQRVSAHVGARMQAAGGRWLSLVAARDGGGWVVENGELWRCYDFIEGCCTYNRAESVAQAREAGRAFGEFLCLVGDLPAESLVETIVGFHNTSSRYERLQAIAAEDPLGRAREVAAELDEIFSRRALAERFQVLEHAGLLPRRVVHNDTKLNNVMFDVASGQAVCVIDFDTVMPGLALHDFGDLVRSATNAADEDAVDSSKVFPRMDLFEGLADGFVAAAGRLLTPVELAELGVAPQVLALELAMRFLSDFLAGDRYFPVSHPRHNLERCRAQLAMLRGFERESARMAEMVAEAVKRYR